jgi:hypothetical protein
LFIEKAQTPCIREVKPQTCGFLIPEWGGGCIMQQPEGCEWGIYFDAVHIITVNYTRQEIRLFECGGSAEGKLLFKKDEPAAKVSANDPYQLMNMAIHFVVSYDLLAELADDETRHFFEQIGIKDFLDRLKNAITDEDRRHRFSGLGPKFTPMTNEVKLVRRRQAIGEPTVAPDKAKPD